MQASYQREHLRAPYKQEVLYSSDDFVFKAHALNISEGGMLLDQIPNFPQGDSVPLMIGLPVHPFFKNFTLEKLKSFSSDLFTTKMVRLRCKVVRTVKASSEVDQVFSSRIAVKFTHIDPIVQKMISEYVDIFASNLIFLQVLIDNLNTDPQNLEKLRLLSQILGYEPDMKMAMLRKTVIQDYQSLQWL